jgi:uncharacterized protein (TIGR04255 family)
MAPGIENLPRFDRPPLVETVLGVQFAPIVNLTAGHYGWFWKGHLDPSWTKAQDAPRLPNQVEKFGDQAGWSIPGLPVVIQGSSEPDRIVFVNSRDDSVIQIQNNKFYYNWRKRQGIYPSFAENYPEFRRYLQIFGDFLREAGLEATPHNQWELSYVNQIPRGALWESPSDWPAIFPGLFGPINLPTAHVTFEAVTGMWRFKIPARKGRLYIVAQNVKTEDNQEVLQVNLTARGPVVAGDDEWGLSAGMTVGHEVLVRTFRDISAPTALTHWGLR